MVFVVNVKLVFYTHLWNGFHLASILLSSLLAYFIFIVIYDTVTTTASYSTVGHLLDSSYFYVCVILIVGIVVVNDGTLRLAKLVFFPSKSDVLSRFSINIKKKDRNTGSIYKNVPQLSHSS